MGPQSRGSPNVGNFGTFGIKSHLDVGLMERRKVYYKGEGGGFPQVWGKSCESEFARGSS